MSTAQIEDGLMNNRHAPEEVENLAETPHHGAQPTVAHHEIKIELPDELRSRLCERRVAVAQALARVDTANKDAVDRTARMERIKSEIEALETSTEADDQAGVGNLIHKKEQLVILARQSAHKEGNREAVTIALKQALFGCQEVLQPILRSAADALFASVVQALQPFTSKRFAQQANTLARETQIVQDFAAWCARQNPATRADAAAAAADFLALYDSVLKGVVRWEFDPIG